MNQYCFHSLQTGKPIQISLRIRLALQMWWVSIPFKRESLSKGPYFKPSGAVGPEAQNYTRTAQGIFFIKI